MICRSGRRDGGEAGFAYLMMFVVLAGVGVLLATMAPGAGGAATAARRREVGAELQALQSALERYFADHQGFPASLQAADFLGTWLAPGPGGSAIVDGWSNSAYRYVVDDVGHTATVYSTDADGRDQGAARETLRVVASGALPAQGRTGQRLRLAAAVAAQFVAGGGTLTGDWSRDRQRLGLGDQFAGDGHGAPLQPVYPLGGGAGATTGGGR
jgi:type II secretory pathway pseudopilin PulG